MFYFQAEEGEEKGEKKRKWKSGEKKGEKEKEGEGKERNGEGEWKRRKGPQFTFLATPLSLSVCR